MKKIFIVAGEVSGDRIAGWYVKKRLAVETCDIEGIGGDIATAAGMRLYERFETLNVVGIVEVLKHLPRLLKTMRTVADHILKSNIEEVVLVDFPGFNLRLAKLLKQQKPTLKITYVSPPQLWAWGAWRIKALKRFTDQVVVMYPFEVAWYRERGLAVSWLGNPVAEQVLAHRAQTAPKQPIVALLPASRASELATMLPLFLAAMSRLKAMHPMLSFVIPVPQSLQVNDYVRIAAVHGFDELCKDICFITDDYEKYRVLQSACVALAKPGTVTLELGLLRVPTVVAYKTSWLSYAIARQVVQVQSMSLPNLLTEKPLCAEFIQQACTVDNIVGAVDALVQQYMHKPEQYAAILRGFDVLEDVLCHRSSLC